MTIKEDQDNLHLVDTNTCKNKIIMKNIVVNY